MLPRVRVQPNPFSEVLRVVLPAQVGVAPQFELFDLHGRSIVRTALRDFETSIPTATLPSGLYTWRISWYGQSMQVGKAIKIE
jgi:hypothetical protein